MRQTNATLRAFGLASLLLCATPLWSQEHQPPKVRQAPAYLADDETRSTTLYERVLPTVVTILTSEQVLTSEGQEIHEGLGSGVLILAFDTQDTCHEQCLVEARRHLAGLDQIRVSYLRGGKRLETEMDVSAGRRNFLSRAPM